MGTSDSRVAIKLQSSTKIGVFLIDGSAVSSSSSTPLSSATTSGEYCFINLELLIYKRYVISDFIFVQPLFPFIIVHQQSVVIKRVNSLSMSFMVLE